MNQQEWDKLKNYDKAWRLGQIMMHMNNEEAYYGGWLYIWPDGETYEQCKWHFEDEEAYKELERSFISHYSHKGYHKDGLYAHKNTPQQVTDDAHFWDEKLGLEPIQVYVLNS